MISQLELSISHRPYIFPISDHITNATNGNDELLCTELLTLILVGVERDTAYFRVHLETIQMTARRQRAFPGRTLRQNTAQLAATKVNPMRLTLG